MPRPTSRSKTPRPSTATVATRQRILEVARTHFFNSGYSALILDELARELGISKKTLYRYFSGKEALVGEIIDAFAREVRTAADALFADGTLSYPVKTRRFVQTMMGRLGTLSPHVIRDLQRYAPALFRKVEQLRTTNIPHIFGELIRQGQVAGLVRADIKPQFAIEFWLPAIQNLMHPDTLYRLRLTPEQVFEQAIGIYFNGLLTPDGREEYE